MSYISLIFLYYNNVYTNKCVYKFGEIEINVKLIWVVLKRKLKICRWHDDAKF